MKFKWRSLIRIAAILVLIMPLTLDSPALRSQSSEPQIVAQELFEEEVRQFQVHPSLSLPTVTSTSLPPELVPNLWDVLYPTTTLSPLPIVLDQVSLVENRPPVLANSPELEALHKANHLLDEGDRLAKAGHKEEAREKWLAAVEAYQQANQRQGEADAYLRLANSYKVKIIVDEQKLSQIINYYMEALSINYQMLIQSKLDLDEVALRDASLIDIVENNRPRDCHQILPSLNEVRDFYQNANLDHLEIQVLMIIVQCKIDNLEYKNALNLILEILQITEPLSLSTPVVELYLKGQEQYEQGDWHNALDTLQKANQQYKEINHEIGIALTTLDLGNIYTVLGDYSEANKLYEQVLAILVTQEDRYNKATIRHNLANLAVQTAHYGEAVKGYRTAIGLWQALGDSVQEVVSLNGLGLALRAQGEYSAALDVFQDAFDLLEQLPPDLESKADLLNHLGSAHFAEANYQQALDFFQQARAVQHGDRLREAETVNNIAAVYMQRGDLTSAKSYLGQALHIFKEIENAKGVEAAQTNLGLLALQAGEWDEAESHFEQVLDAQADPPNPVTVSRVLGHLALLDAKQDDLQSALIRGKEALRLSKLGGTLVDQGQLLIMVGTIHFDLGDYPVTLDYALQALDLARQIADPVTEIGSHMLFAATYMAMNDSHQGNNHLQSAVSRLEALPGDMMIPELKSMFLGQMPNVYALAALLAAEFNLPEEESFRYAEGAQARAFLDQLANGGARPAASAATLIERLKAKKAQIAARRTQLFTFTNRPRSEWNEDVINAVQDEVAAFEADYEALLEDLKTSNSEAAALVSVKVASLAEVQAQLDANTTLVEYLVTSGQIQAFIITRDKFERVSLDINYEELSKTIDEFFKIPAGERNNAHRAQLQQLYISLIAPLKPYLTTPMLGIVPDGVLHYLPFAALSDGERYLGDDYVLFTLPNASTWYFLQKKRKLDANTVLVLGNPITTESLPDLRFAAQGVNTIADLHGSSALVGAAATESALKQAVSAQILHLAAPCQYNHLNPLFSTIYLAEDKENDGHLEVHEVYGLDLSATDLVVLSSGQTELLRNGDEVASFSQAFLFAGVSTVITTRWNVDDEATALLMAQFYTHLNSGIGKAQAFYQAQLDVREEYPDPYYWAGFVLTGLPGNYVPTPPPPPWPWVVGLLSSLGLILMVGFTRLTHYSGLPPTLLLQQKSALIVVGLQYPSYQRRWESGTPLEQLVVLLVPTEEFVDVEQLEPQLTELDVPADVDQIGTALDAVVRNGLFLRKAGGYGLAEPSLGRVLQAHQGIESRLALAEQIRRDHPLSINAHRFLENAGFTTLTLIEEPFLYRCETTLVNWTTLLPSTVYVRLLPNHILNGQQVRDIRDKVKGVDDGALIVFVITDQRPTYDGWGQIVTLGYESEPFTVLPIKSALINEGLATRNEEARLREEIEKRLGAHDPYNVTTPVTDFSFFGRDDFVKTLLRRITFGQPVGIFGLRKLGKSSVLHALQEQAPFPVVLVSLETIGEDESLDLYQRILDDLAQWTSVRLGIEWEPPFIIATDAPTGTFVRAIRDLLGCIKKVRGEARVGVFFDEIEVIVPRPERRDSLTRYLSLLRPLRGLVDEGVSLSLVVAGLNPALNRIDNWDGERNPVFQFFQEIYLPPLEDEDCIQMVSSIGAQIRLQYSLESLQLISKLSGGHPFLARQLCSLLYKAHGDKNNAIEVSDVNNTVNRFMDDESTEIRLTRIWQEAGNEKVWGAAKAKINQSVLLDLARAGGSVAYDDLLASAKGKAHRTALINLERFHFVYQPQMGRYAIRFGLLEKWLLYEGIICSEESGEEV